MEYSGPPGFWNSEGGRRRKTPIARTSAKLSSKELNERGVDIESAGTSEDVAVLRVVSKFQSRAETCFIREAECRPPVLLLNFRLCRPFDCHRTSTPG